MPKIHDMGTQADEHWIAFSCPGCDNAHSIPVSGPRKWDWNGSVDKPTIYPSVFVNKGSTNPTVPACHIVITDGIMAFSPDSTHKLSGQSVPMPEWDW